jgi:putative DNA primase/helicase
MNFREAMTAYGLNPRDIVADGRWYRCSTADHPKKKNGCYLLRPCGSRGYFRNYALDDEWREWHDDQPMTLAQRVRADFELAAARRREAERRMRAVRQMRAYWGDLSPLRGVQHPYLEGKGLPMMGCTGLRVDGDLLVIPAMRRGALVSLQTITPAGEKRYRHGCQIRGASCALTRPRATLSCLVEGFATGLAVYQSLPQSSVVVCFDAGNMVQVATEMNLLGMTVVCADNDWETAGRTGINTGVEKGCSAAEALGCGVAYPEGIGGSDWADALAEWGERGPHWLRMEIMRRARAVFASE